MELLTRFVFIKASSMQVAIFIMWEVLMFSTLPVTMAQAGRLWAVVLYGPGRRALCGLCAYGMTSCMLVDLLIMYITTTPTISLPTASLLGMALVGVR